MKLQEDGDRMLLVSVAGDVLGRASYTGRVLYTDLRPCTAKSTTPTTEVVALRAIVSVTKSMPDRLHARLAHVGMNTIRSSAKHEVATELDLNSASGTDLPCVSCVGGKLARHTFPDQGSDADDVLAVVYVDLCGPLWVAAKDGSLYFLLLKYRKTRYVWVRPVAKKSDALQEFVQWLAVTERQTKKSVLMLRSDRGGEFLGKQFTDFVNGKGIIHNLTCPYIPQQNGMAEREMRTVVESVRTMLLHMGVQHHWKKPNLSLARVWGCMAQFLVPEQWLGGKLKPKAKWGLHLGVSEESKGWELLDIANNRVVTTSDVVFYENMSLEVWKSEHEPASGRTPTISPTDTLTATLPLLAKVGEPAAEDVKDVPSPFPSPAPRAPPLVADLRGLTPVSASGDEGRSGASRVAPAKGISAGELTTGEKSAEEPTKGQKVGSLQSTATMTRPDIAFACSKLGSGLTVRSNQHWREVNCCLAYLANTHDTALEFGSGAESLKLVGYMDVDDAGDKQNQTSTGGYLDAGTPTVLRVDNKLAITVTEGMGLTGNLKHMERRQAWLQHMVKHTKFSLRYIPTAKQPADFLMKALHYPAFKWCSVAIGQVRLVNVGDGDNDVQ
ncbi:unnamed protein product [Closterium sp. NIES-54]